MLSDAFGTIDYKLSYEGNVTKIVNQTTGEEAYYHLTNKDINNNPGLLDRCLYLSDAIWHSLSVLYDSKLITTHNRQLTLNELNKITHSTVYMFIRAYDAEGYVIWGKNSASSTTAR